MAHVNLDVDLEGDTTSIAATIGAILNAADQHPDGYTISAQFTSGPRTSDGVSEIRQVAELNATSISEIFKPISTNERSLAARFETVVAKHAGITNVGQLRIRSRAEVLEITGVGIHMMNLLERDLRSTLGIELRDNK